jgi:hypothetical protein
VTDGRIPHTNEPKPPTVLLPHDRYLESRIPVGHMRSLGRLEGGEAPVCRVRPFKAASVPTAFVPADWFDERCASVSRGVPGRVKCLDVRNPFPIHNPGPYLTSLGPILESMMRNNQYYFEATHHHLLHCADTPLSAWDGT